LLCGEVAIPTLGRHLRAQEIGKPGWFSDEDRDAPFILARTLRLLERQQIPPAQVTLFVAPKTERYPAEARLYREALAKSDYWREVKIVEGELGIIRQRHFITQHYGEGVHVVSMDDDLKELNYKAWPGTFKTLTAVEPGALKQLIYFAQQRMVKTQSHIWGLSTSTNPMCH
jgi:hypothetical protein